MQSYKKDGGGLNVHGHYSAFRKLLKTSRWSNCLSDDSLTYLKEFQSIGAGIEIEVLSDRISNSIFKVFKVLTIHKSAEYSKRKFLCFKFSMYEPVQKKKPQIVVRRLRRAYRVDESVVA